MEQESFRVFCISVPETPETVQEKKKKAVYHCAFDTNTYS